MENALKIWRMASVYVWIDLDGFVAIAQCVLVAVIQFYVKKVTSNEI